MDLNDFRAARDNFLAGTITDPEMTAIVTEWFGGPGRNTQETMKGWRRIREGKRLHGAHACKRCGGAGGSNQWPGWACFDCDGSGRAAE